MPVLLEQRLPHQTLSLLSGVRCVPTFPPQGARTIEVGFVNNMPDGALETTERQFIGLLGEASGNSEVRVRLFYLPRIPRGPATFQRLRANYAEIEFLFAERLDGLIVTGMEPGAGALSEEPYWPSFVDLVEWAGQHTTSSIWSCLAAHAAVLHCDQIHRRKLLHKCFGVFVCEKVGSHPLLMGAPTRASVPHSRWNEVPLDALVAARYQILTQSDKIGADMFIKDDRSLFVFLQGHPEYDPATLYREYRRDVGRYLKGESETYPQMPSAYLNATHARSLEAFRVRALSMRDPTLMETFPVVAVRNRLAQSWRASALCLYRNWISYLFTRRQQSIRNVASANAGER
jgi:homoserine O-succinyltransferase/O-acetyltransferase